MRERESIRIELAATNMRDTKIRHLFGCTTENRVATGRGKHHMLPVVLNAQSLGMLNMAKLPRLDRRVHHDRGGGHGLTVATWFLAFLGNKSPTMHTYIILTIEY